MTRSHPLPILHLHPRTLLNHLRTYAFLLQFPCNLPHPILLLQGVEEQADELVDCFEETFALGALGEVHAPEGGAVAAEDEVVDAGGEQRGDDVEVQSGGAEQGFVTLYRAAVKLLAASGKAAGGGVVVAHFPDEEALHVGVGVEGVGKAGEH